MPHPHYRLYQACLALIGLSTVLPAIAQTESIPLMAPPANSPTKAQVTAGELESVIVTASKYEDDSLKVPAFVTYLTRSQIENSGARTVNEAVMRLAGIPGRPSLAGGIEYSLDPMGFGDTFSSNMVIAIDGVPLKEGDSAEPRLSSIPIEQVERIEIQRGGASVLYGENAVAGVINVITRASSTDFSPQSYANVYTGLGSFNTQELSGSGYYAANGMKLSVAGYTRASDGYRRHSASSNRAATLDAQVQREESRFGVSLHADDLKADLPGALTVAQFKANPRQRQYKHRNDDIDSRVMRLGGFFEANTAGLNLKLTGNRRIKDIVFDGTLPTQRQPNNLDTVNDFWDLVIRKTSSVAKNQNTLLVGLELNRWQQDRDNQFGIYDFSTKAQALYLKNDFDINSPSLRLSAGFRKEKIDRKIIFYDSTAQKNGSVIDSREPESWELGLSRKIDNHNSIYARVSRSYRLPNIDEASYLYVQIEGMETDDWKDDVYRFDRISLVNPQTADDHELGWKSVFPNGSRIGLRIFRSSLKNEIAYDADSYSNINLDRTRRSGMDIDVVYTPYPTLTISGFGSLRSSRFVSGPYKGQEIPMAPQRLAALRADWKFSAQQTLGVGWNCVGSQYASTDFENKFRIPAYSTTDLRYTYRQRNMEGALTIRNVLDKSYYSYGTSSQGYLAVYPDPGRSITASLRVNF